MAEKIIKCSSAKSYSKGFTLAEVLITIGIIGTIAAFTIPTLMHNIQNQHFATALKNFYSDFNNALNLIKQDYGCTDLACTGIFNVSVNNYSALWSNLQKNNRLKVLKYCGTADGAGCFSSSQTYLNNGSCDIDNTWYYAVKFVLANGISVALMPNSDWSNCTNNLGNGVLSAVCGTIVVDVNGTQAPNKWGRDIFEFYITNQGLAPYGSMNLTDSASHWDNNSQGRSCIPGSSGVGSTCAARIMDKSWQIDY